MGKMVHNDECFVNSKDATQREFFYSSENVWKISEGNCGKMNIKSRREKNSF